MTKWVQLLVRMIINEGTYKFYKKQLAIDHEVIINYVFITCETGVFAIAKPCSIVVSLKELYGSESKTQEYGHLHELLQQPDTCNIDMLSTHKL